MRHKNIFVLGAIFFVLAICTSIHAQGQTGAANGKAGADTTKSTSAVQNKMVFAKLQGCFGFSDEHGQRILMKSDPDSPDTDDCKHRDFDAAIGDGKITAELKFSRQQNETKDNAMADTSYNFNNLAGNIFTRTKGTLKQNGTYFISTKKWFENSLIPLSYIYHYDMTENNHRPVDTKTKSRIESIKHRGISKSELLAKTKTGARIWLCVFKKQGNNMLASVVYVDAGKVIFSDYPAEYSDVSTWRVGDGGVDPGVFEVLFLAQTDEGLVLAITWNANEGENAYIYKEKNGTFVETRFSSYRYWGAD